LGLNPADSLRPESMGRILQGTEDRARETSPLR